VVGRSSIRSKWRPEDFRFAQEGLRITQLPRCADWQFLLTRKQDFDCAASSTIETGKAFSGKKSKLAPAEVGMASEQVSGGNVGRSFMPPWVGNAGGRLTSNGQFLTPDL